jgi:Family of unknown function (DUF6314)
MRKGADLYHRAIADLWGQLQCIRHLRIVATSKAPLSTSWKGRGNGSVEVKVEGLTIIFIETGVWHIGQAGEVRFGNVYRWSRAHDRIRLEHLRHGTSRPVYLFDFVPRDDLRNPEVPQLVLAPVRPHQCGDDVYEGMLRSSGEGIRLDWSIQGPRKAAEIHILYL